MSDEREYVELPSVITLRPSDWFLVEPDGSIQRGSETGWRRSQGSLGELLSRLDSGVRAEGGEAE